MEISRDEPGYDHEAEQEAYEESGGGTDPDAGPASEPSEVDRDQAEGAPEQTPDT